MPEADLIRIVSIDGGVVGDGIITYTVTVDASRFLEVARRIAQDPVTRHLLRDRIVRELCDQELGDGRA